jgi:hypothetical protein
VSNNSDDLGKRFLCWKAGAQIATKGHWLPHPSTAKYFQQPGTDVMIKKTFSPKNLAKNGGLTQNNAKLCKTLIITLVLEKNANFCGKLSKIAENCDHNIGPRWLVFRPVRESISSSELKKLQLIRCMSQLEK